MTNITVDQGKFKARAEEYVNGFIVNITSETGGSITLMPGELTDLQAIMVAVDQEISLVEYERMMTELGDANRENEDHIFHVVTHAHQEIRQANG